MQTECPEVSHGSPHSLQTNAEQDLARPFRATNRIAEQTHVLCMIHCSDSIELSPDTMGDFQSMWVDCSVRTEWGDHCAIIVQSLRPSSRPRIIEEKFSHWNKFALLQALRIKRDVINICILPKKKKTPWSESASELYRPSDRRLSAK
jgi:hypothetical protein